MRLTCCTAELRLSRLKPYKHAASTSPKPQPPSPTPSTIIERFGQPTGRDVLLLVGPDPTTHSFLIAASILRQLGPRWATLIARAPPRRRATNWLRGQPLTLRLRDEQPLAIRIVLLIATLQFARVPRVLDFGDVVEVARVAARWGAHALLAGYMEEWVERYEGRLLAEGYEGWLVVAGEFGYGREFGTLAGWLAVRCGDGIGGLVRPGGVRLEGRVGADTLALIRGARTQILCNIMKATYELWADMSKGITCKATRDCDLAAQESCAAHNFSVFTKFLRELGLFPMLKTVQGFRISPKDLAAKLSDVQMVMRIAKTESMSRRASAPVEQSKHAQCHVGFQLKTIMTRILEDVTWPMDMSTSTGVRGDEITGVLETDPNILNVR